MVGRGGNEDVTLRLGRSQLVATIWVGDACGRAGFYVGMGDFT